MKHTEPCKPIWPIIPRRALSSKAQAASEKSVGQPREKVSVEVFERFTIMSSQRNKSG